MSLEAVSAQTLKKTAGNTPPRPARELPSARGFRFHFFRRPAPGSEAAAIAGRWERGEISGHLANTLLMDAFSRRGDLEAFSVLYQLNLKSFQAMIRKKLAGFRNLLNPADVFQDVFIAIYRYSGNFRSENDRSFCNWSYAIITNTIRRKLGKFKVRTVEMSAIDVDEVAENGSLRTEPSPLKRLIDREETECLKRLYLFSLLVYLNAYRTRLKGIERKALRLVEVGRMPYREAAARLEVSYDNFKMMVFRARRKILAAVTAWAEGTVETPRKKIRVGSGNRNAPDGRTSGST